jgi:hypothetical protein
LSTDARFPSNTDRKFSALGFVAMCQELPSRLDGGCNERRIAATAFHDPIAALLTDPLPLFLVCFFAFTAIRDKTWQGPPWQDPSSG